MTRVASTSAMNLAKKLAEAGIRHPAVLHAVATTPRELFLDGALAHKAYENTALPIGQGQTISQPYIVAAAQSSKSVRDWHWLRLPSSCFSIANS